MTDVSPDFIPNKLDAALIYEVVRHWETPRAIRYFHNRHQMLSDYAFWYLLGTLWVSYSGQSELALWRRHLSSARPKRESSLMKPSELAIFRQLPETLRLFRAHRPGATDWLAYTLDPQKAGLFARQRDVSSVTEYSCRRENALCLFTRRGESEILVLDRAHVAPVRTLEVVMV